MCIMDVFSLLGLCWVGLHYLDDRFSDGTRGMSHSAVGLTGFHLGSRSPEKVMVWSSGGALALAIYPRSVGQAIVGLNGPN